MGLYITLNRFHLIRVINDALASIHILVPPS